MPTFTDRELKLLINSTHERAMYLLDRSLDMARVDYPSCRGKLPTKKDREAVYNGHKEHLLLVEKLRVIRKMSHVAPQGRIAPCKQQEKTP